MCSCEKNNWHVRDMQRSSCYIKSTHNFTTPAFPRRQSLHFSGAVSLVNNPFVIGMTLSVALEDAAPKAGEGHQVLSSLQNDVDELLREVKYAMVEMVRQFYPCNDATQRWAVLSVLRPTCYRRTFPSPPYSLVGPVWVLSGFKTTS